MNLMPMKASLLALALFAGPALADSQLPPGSMIVAQAEDDAQGGDRIAAIQKFLASKQKVEKMTDERLAQRLKRARNLLQTKDLTAELQGGLNAEIAELEAEIARRGSAQAETQPETQPEVQADTAETQPEAQQPETGTAPATTAALPADAEAFLNERVQLSTMSVKDLRARAQKAQGFAKTETLPRNVRIQMREIVKATRAEIQSRQAAGGTAQDTDTAAGTGAGQQPVDANGGNEAKAKAFIADAASVEKMPSPELRKRLQAMRDLLANGKLSKPTQQALRKQLAADRTILRSRVGNANANQQGNAGNGNAGNGSGTNDTTTINNTTVNVILKDRRPSKDLTDAELRRRIRVLREAERDSKYNEADRRFWRETVELDRRFLNQRLRDNRMRRQGELKSAKINIDLGVNFRPDRRPPRYVFAAEANDDDLEEILVAPPRREIGRRYTVDEISNDEDVRDAVARIEIDTVRFGFGEGFLREEEIENLETIAEIMERILVGHPGEVFMIEGHTDAVGSAESNLALSRERAAAVKAALVKFFVIPPENLKTVGLGERFLKIPTEEAEAENRRVSVARITALVGSLDR